MVRTLGGGGALHPFESRRAIVLHGHSAAQRDRVPPYGACPEQHASGCPVPLQAHGRPQRAVGARNRSRGHCHPERGGAATRRRGPGPDRPGAASVHRESLELARADRPHHPAATARPGRLPCDWSRERFTMDEGLSRAVREAFVRLWEEGLLYRAERLINWCPRCKTALADIEVVHEEVDGHLWQVRYPLVGDGELVWRRPGPRPCWATRAWPSIRTTSVTQAASAATRGCPSRAGRFRLVADTFVDPEFGTGAVKITPGHDFNDFEIGLRNSLEVINILDDDAAIRPGLSSAKMAGRLPGSSATAVRTGSPRGNGSSGSSRNRACWRRSNPTVTRWASVTAARRSSSPTSHPVVREGQAAGGPGHGGGAPGPDPDRSGDLEELVLRVDGEHQGLVRLAADLVGPSDPGLVLHRL